MEDAAAETKIEYSKTKPLLNLAILMIVGGIYHVYWYGQNWQYLAQYKKYRVPNGVKLLAVIFSPALTILLAVFKLPLWLIVISFPISLIGVALVFMQLNDIKNLAQEKGCRIYHYPKLTLTYMVFMSIYSNVYLIAITSSDGFRNYISRSLAVNLGLTLLATILGLIFYFFLLLAQKTLNGVWEKEQPNLAVKKGFSKGEIIFLIIAFLAGWGISGQLLSLGKTVYQKPASTTPSEAVESPSKNSESTLQETNQNINPAETVVENNTTESPIDTEMLKAATAKAIEWRADAKLSGFFYTTSFDSQGSLKKDQSLGYGFGFESESPDHQEFAISLDSNKNIINSEGSGEIGANNNSDDTGFIDLAKVKISLAKAIDLGEDYRKNTHSSLQVNNAGLLLRLFYDKKLGTHIWEYKIDTSPYEEPEWGKNTVDIDAGTGAFLGSGSFDTLDSLSNNNQNSGPAIKQVEVCTSSGQLAGGISYEKTQATYWGESFNEYVMKRNGAELARIVSDKCHPYVFRQTDKYIFLASDRTEKGRVLYPGSPDIYRIDLEKNHSDHITFEMPENSVALDDISADGQLALFSARGLFFGGKIRSSASMVVVDIDTSEVVHRFPVPEDYLQPGSGKFSPNGKKIAYAAGDTGSVDLEQWPSGIPSGKYRDKFAVFVIDIETGQQTEVASREEDQDTNHLNQFVIDDWSGDTPNYSFKDSAQQ